MTAGITKRPAQVRMALGRGVVYVVLGVVFAGGTVMLAGAARPTIERDRAVAETWRGSGDMSTQWVKLAAGQHFVEWDAPCALVVDVWRHRNGEDTYIETAGLSSRGRQPMTLESGNYFLSVGAACDWTASIR